MTSKVKLLYLALTALLLVLFSISVFGETTPVADGAGYDGEFYRKVFENFSTDFWGEGYDSFRIQRIFPFCLMHLVYKVAGIPFSHTSMINGMYVLHFVNLALQLLLFFKFVLNRKWKASTVAILFSLFFFNYYTIKNCGYEPFQTDAFALTIALAAYYALDRGKTALSYAISLLGLVTWPTVTLVNLLLILFRQKPDEAPSKFSKLLFRIAPFAYGAGVALLFAAFLLFNKTRALCELIMAKPSFPHTALAFVAIIAFLFYFFKKATPIPYSPKSFLKGFDWKTLALVAIPFIAIKLILGVSANSEFYYDGKLFLLQIIFRPIRTILVTPAGHLAYWGLLPVLALLTATSFTQNFAKRSAGHGLALLALLLFSLDSEARHIITFIPLMLLPLGESLDGLQIKPYAAALIVTLQLAASHFYIPINVEGFAEAMEQRAFLDYPAQRFFMSFGPWMSIENVAITLVFGVIVYFALKKLLFSHKKTDDTKVTGF